MKRMREKRKQTKRGIGERKKTKNNHHASRVMQSC